MSTVSRCLPQRAEALCAESVCVFITDSTRVRTKLYFNKIKSERRKITFSSATILHMSGFFHSSSRQPLEDYIAKIAG